MAQPAHILFLIDSYFGGTGGAEAVLSRIVRLLPRDRFRCSVITFRANPTLGHADELDCPFYVFPLDRTYDLRAFRAALAIRRYIKAENVVIAHTFFETADLWAAPVARLCGVPHLISSRRDMGILRQPKHRRFYRWLAPIYDQVQVVSNEVGAFAIREDGLDPKRVITVYNGIEPGLFAEGATQPVSRESLGVGGHGQPSQLILTVGNIRRVKGFDTLIDAAAIVCRQFPEAHFVIAGNPHEPDFYRQLLAQRAALRLERNVIFLGKRTDIANLMASSDLFALPSRSEGLSNALLEAMASRLPVVATRVGGNPEVVGDGVSGYLVQAEDAEALAARITSLLSNSAQAKAMGIAGKNIVETQFNVQAMVLRMTQAYEALLSK